MNSSKYEKEVDQQRIRNVYGGGILKPMDFKQLKMDCGCEFNIMESKVISYSLCKKHLEQKFKKDAD